MSDLFFNLISMVFIMEYGVWPFFPSLLLSSQALPPLSTFSLTSCGIRFILLDLSFFIFFCKMFFQYFYSL